MCFIFKKDIASIRSWHENLKFPIIKLYKIRFVSNDNCEKEPSFYLLHHK